MVVTQPDRPSGRGKHVKTPAIKEYCQKEKLLCVQPKKMKDEKFLDQLRSLEAKTFLVAAYGRILPFLLLEIPKLILNVHASLLPRWRGAAPIQKAIWSGDLESGVSIMRLVQELDAGDVLSARSTPIGPDETGGELESRLASIGGALLVEALDQLDRGEGQFQKQDQSRVTLAPPIRSEEGRIDWSRPSQEVHNHVRAFNPRPGAFALDQGKRLKVHRTALCDKAADSTEPGKLRSSAGRLYVACSDRWLEVREVQKEGRAAQKVSAFLPGYRDLEKRQWE